MKQTQTYLSALSESIQQLAHQQQALEQAAQILAKAQKEDQLIHVFGVEPAAAALTSEVFFRAGALTNINPIFDPALDPAHGAYRSAMCQQLDGLAPCILDYYEYVQAGEPILLLGSDPEAIMFRQALDWARAKGLVTIALVCRDTDCTADVVLRHGSMADALTEAGSVPAGGDQAAVLSALLHALVIETLEQLPDAPSHVWKGRHLVEVEANQQAIDRLLFRIRHL